MTFEHGRLALLDDVLGGPDGGGGVGVDDLLGDRKKGHALQLRDRKHPSMCVLGRNSLLNQGLAFALGRAIRAGGVPLALLRDPSERLAAGAPQEVSSVATDVLRASGLPGRSLGQGYACPFHSKTNTLTRRAQTLSPRSTKVCHREAPQFPSSASGWSAVAAWETRSRLANRRREIDAGMDSAPGPLR